MHNSYINETPPIDGEVCDLVDWIEFKALSNEFKIYRLSDLRSLSEEIDDVVDDDIAYQDNIDEAKLQEVFSEIELRQTSLADAYPFILNERTHELIAQEATNRTVGGWVYLYCLIISHAKSDEVLKESIGLTPQDKRRDHLQVAATFAAGAEFGNAVSFGFPRPEHKAILAAIKHVFTQYINEGICADKPKDGYLTDSKDAGIDVIAWKDSLDKLPGKLTMYGQVASGYNWQDKSIINDVEIFHNTFFYDRPGSHWIPAMFIPFCLTRDKAKIKTNRMNALTQQFGIIYYRYRLPRLAQIGYERGVCTENECHIERISESECFKTFVESFMQPPA